MLFASIDEASTDNEAGGFTSGDHLFVWAWRRIAFGQARCPMLAREFVETFGEDGADVLAALHLFVDTISAYSTYRLSLGMPGGFTLARDEERVLSLLAAAQADDTTSLAEGLERLTRPEHRQTVSIAVRALAKAFCLNGIGLRVPAGGIDLICPQQALAS